MVARPGAIPAGLGRLCKVVISLEPDMLPFARRLAPLAFRVRRLSSQVPPQSPQLSEGERTIYTKLEDKFTPTELLVQDVSGQHHLSLLLVFN
jgi:hypothetical protein